MGRIRTIKPEFFKHSGLYDLEQETRSPIRVAFAGLWTCADRAGRFKWRPRELKLDILPYDDCDFSRVLDALASRGFIVKYASGAEVLGYIPTWKSHQFINNKEAASTIPEPTKNECIDATITRESREPDADDTRGVKEGKGKEVIGKGKARPPQTSHADWDADEEACIPDDLPAAQLGAWMLQRLSIPHSYSLVVKFADAVDLLARDESLRRGEAARVLLDRGRRQPPQDGIWSFWLEDGRWKQAKMQGVSLEGLE